MRPFARLAALVATLGLLAAMAACTADRARIQVPPPAQEDNDGGQPDDERAPVVRYDEPFRLAFGQAVEVEQGRARARFVELVEDSRCPREVQCIQAGRARVRLTVEGGTAPAAAIELSTDVDESVRSAGSVTFELQAVEPYPAAGIERRAEQYVLTLVVRPLR
jgi:hypothetical protein